MGHGARAGRAWHDFAAPFLNRVVQRHHPEPNTSAEPPPATLLRRNACDPPRSLGPRNHARRAPSTRHLLLDITQPETKPSQAVPRLCRVSVDPPDGGHGDTWRGGLDKHAPPKELPLRSGRRPHGACREGLGG